MRKLFFFLLVLVFMACANQGQGPDGGPYDETPPKVVRMSPAIGQLNAKNKKIEIVFDENIKVENGQENIIVSPPQLEPPEISSSGKRIKIELLDTLKPNTTYTIDFGDAIVDNNEGNPLGTFTYYFSTGEKSDTMEISGHVIDAENLSPLQGLLVGLYYEDSDSAVLQRPLDRVGRTDESGFFSIKGVPQGRYRLYALKDMDGDYKFSSRAEMIGFTDSLLTTSCFTDMRYDTIWRDTTTYDSIVATEFTHYLPDNVVIKAFQHTNVPRHFLKQQRDVPQWFRMYFTGPSQHVPEIKGLNFDATDAFVEDRNKGNDTITYWLKDTAMYKQDTLMFAYTFYETDDSANIDTLRTDTIELISRVTFAKQQKELREKMEKWQKQLEKRHKRGDYSDEKPPIDYMKIELRSNSGQIAPNQNPELVFPEPLVRLDTQSIHLLLGPDTMQTPARFRLIQSPYEKGRFKVFGEWRYDQRYTLEIDSAALYGLSGSFNNGFKGSFKVAAEKDFGTCMVNVAGADTNYVVQFMADETKILQEARVSKYGNADFYYIRPGKYYLRLFIDKDGDGKWTTGDIVQRRQAETVYYYPEQFEVRAGWDEVVNWNPTALPITKQKPEKLIKSKKKKAKQTAHQKNVERTRERR